MQPAAVVMNMFHTGLGIARSLGRRGIPVIGLTAQRGIFGNATRYARTVPAPDSRQEPEAMLEQLVRMGKTAGESRVLFPTRDHDLVLLDRFRPQLQPYYALVVPPPEVLGVCLNKWETYLSALRAGVPSPKCWVVEDETKLRACLPELTFPCVLKPLASFHWREARNWEIVGGRKAIGVSSREELLAEYSAIAGADRRALLQEMVPGDDDALAVVACYLDRGSNWVAGFHIRKLMQGPKGFGTGYIVQTASHPELEDLTRRLLQSISYSGIAEVEYKRDAATGEYKLIEINPRPWDQHPLCGACGTDLIYAAYCEHAGLPRPRLVNDGLTRKWIAEDAFILSLLSSLRRRDPSLTSLLRASRGRRVYAIWSARDPLPFLLYVFRTLLPALVSLARRAIGLATQATFGWITSRKKLPPYPGRLGKGDSHA